MSNNPFDPNATPNPLDPAQPSATPPSFSVPQYNTPEPGAPTPPPTYAAPGAASYSQPNYSQPGMAPYTPMGVQMPQGNLAQWPTRALGGVIDYVIPGVIYGILINAFSRVGFVQFVVWAALLAWQIYNNGYLQGTTGQSWGKKIAKTRLISEETGQPVGFGMAIVRQLCHFVDVIICYVGFLFPLWDVKRQTIADKIMKTVVVTE